jgi:hypothetical protein
MPEDAPKRIGVIELPTLSNNNLAALILAGRTNQ